MRLVKAAGLCGLAAISLAACGRNAAPTAANSSAPSSAAVASAAPAAPAAPSAIPHRREGLWEQKMTMADMKMVQTSEICLDQAFEEKMAFGAQGMRSKCSNYAINHQLNGDWT